MLEEAKYNIHLDRLLKEFHLNVTRLNIINLCSIISFSEDIEKLKSSRVITIYTKDDVNTTCNMFDYIDEVHPNNEMYFVLNEFASDTFINSLISNEDEIIGGWLMMKKDFMFTDEWNSLLGYYEIRDLNIFEDVISFTFTNKDYNDGNPIAAYIHIHSSGKVVGCKAFEYQLLNRENKSVNRFDPDVTVVGRLKSNEKSIFANGIVAGRMHARQLLAGDESV